jgi:DNA-binding beta-propeller fold protein YncE
MSVFVICRTQHASFRYVAETMQNRVLRFFQQPTGVYHGSVFYQLSGGVGPSSIVLDQASNQLYVAHYDVRDSANEGTILVLSSAGKLLRTISVGGPEISGLAIL